MYRERERDIHRERERESQWPDTFRRRHLRGEMPLTLHTHRVCLDYTITHTVSVT